MKKRRILSAILLLAVSISSVTVFPKTAVKVQAATASDVVRVAASQVGYHEKASNANLDDYTANSGSANYTKYARDLGVGNGQPWCAYFVWWCMQTAGVDSNNYPRVGYATRDWFRSRGLWHDRGTYTPNPGDYIAFGASPDHCGIVESVSNGTVHTIEGNSSDQVIRRSYALSNNYIMGYGSIQYGVAPIDNNNPGSPYAVPSGNIGQGSSGDGTRWIQTALNNLMGAGLAVDGIFGAGTKNAVVQFQSANGLAADGIVGNDTRNKMIAVWKAKQDTVKPIISNVKISDKSSIGYVVECDVSDNVGVTKVQFPTWTTKNDQDDLKWVDATVSNGHAKAYINISDHNYETGTYITHVYAWDAVGNQAFAGAGTISLPQITDGILQNLGESFVAQITVPGSKALLQSADKIIASGLEKGNKAQQWKFTRNSDGTYFISNLGNNKNMDVSGGVDANGTDVWTCSFNGSDAQKWYIYQNKSRDYYFAPKLSKYRVMDRASSSGQMHLWDFYGDANAAQLFGLSMVIESTPTPVPTKAPTESPNYTEVPIRTKEPEYTETPLRTEQPLISSAPENPVHTEQPSKTTAPEFPVGTKQPTVTKTPSASQKPIATERPWSTQIPEETNTGNQEAADISNQENNAMDEEDDYYHISKKPSQVRNLSLKNKKNRKIIVRWKKVSGVSGYQIQYAQNKQFVIQCRTKNIGSGNTKNVIKGLKKGKKYFVRIRAYNRSGDKKIYGQWSKVKSIKIRK